MSEEPIEIEEKMTTDSHSRSSERDHSRSRVKKDVKADGMDVEYERENVDIRMQFNLLIKLFQRSKEYQIFCY